MHYVKCQVRIMLYFKKVSYENNQKLLQVSIKRDIIL